MLLFNQYSEFYKHLLYILAFIQCAYNFLAKQKTYFACLFIFCIVFEFFSKVKKIHSVLKEYKKIQIQDSKIKKIFICILKKIVINCC